MQKRYELATERSGRRHRRTFAWALALSVMLHAAAFLVWSGAGVPAPGGGVRGESSPSRSADPGGALVAVRATPVGEREIPPPPRPVLEPRRPEVEPREPPTAAARFSRETSAGLRPVGLRLSGSTGGPGEGERAGAGEGEGPRRVIPPVPRALFPEWDPPSRVKGRRVTVRVRVDVNGQATGEVELVPPTPDRAFNRRLMEKATRMEYRPARLDGKPVAGWAEITFVF